MPRSERVILDEDLQNRYIEHLRSVRSLSPEDVAAISEIFTQAVELASGDYSTEAFKFVVRLWLAVFKDRCGGSSLEKELLESRPRVVNLCINNLSYKAYLACTAPLPGSQFWADTVARTLQFEALSKGELRFSNANIIAFLNGTSDIQTKRRMVATFLRKALLYSRHGHDFSTILSAFIHYTGIIGDGHLLLIGPEHSVYQKALSILSRPRGNVSVFSHIHMIEGIVMRSEYANKHILSNLLSSLATYTATTRPSAALEYWKFKTLELKSSSDEFLTLHDLLIAMWALFRLQQYEECLELHRKYPSLHNDQQIDTFLRISEKTKDWKHLQKQFEDMYGRGDLPYVQHYAIVMNALASIKVVKEVDELFEQLQRRNLSPSCEVYGAVIKSKLATHDFDGAEEWFDKLLKSYEEGKVTQGNVARVHALVFDLHFHASALPKLMKALHSVIERQKSCSVPLIDTKLYCNLITAVGSNYGVKELEEIWDIAERFSMKTEDVYEKMINALTRFGDYERADTLCFEAHMESSVPFNSSLIYKAQLKNLRSWHNATTDGDLKTHLARKAVSVLRRLDQGKVSLKDRTNLLVEAIKFELSVNRRNTARSYLEQAKALESLNEEHFLPFLRYHCQARSYKGASTVLELYREMAANKIDITSKTYVYLIRALIEIDRSNAAKYTNTYKLLESVFELYGLSMFEHIKPMRTSAEDIHYHAENLLKIVSLYVTATTHQIEANMDLVVHFLNQMKDRLGNKIPVRFRLAIFKEMGHLYHLTGDNVTAKKLVLNALDELLDVADNFRKGVSNESALEPQLPKLLQLDIRQVMEILVPILREMKALPDEYELITHSLLQRNVHLAGPLFRTLIEHILKGEVGESKINVILDICERFLVASNWTEVSIAKKQQYIYKLFILCLARRMPEERIFKTYSLLNKFYNVKSIKTLKSELSNVKYPLGKLEQSLDEYGDLTSFRWTTNTLFKDPHKFFVPGRNLPTRNTMDPRMTAKIYSFLGKYCEDDRSKAFKLFDKYPETVEYLLYFGLARTRLQTFRNEIDKIQPPLASSANEGRKNRRYRTLRALRRTMNITSR